MNTIERNFHQFHNENPQVYTELRDLALPLRLRGWEQYGISPLFEVLRYDRALKTTDHDFKLNNNYRAHYSRLLMRQEPLLRGFFRTRVLSSQPPQTDPWLAAP